MSPPSPPHSFSSDEIRDIFQSLFGDGYWVRLQLPLSHGDYSQPEPDVSVVRGSRKDFQKAHPKSAVLVVEVSRTSLDYDTQTKPQLYAAMGVPEYWVLDLVHRQLIVHRQPLRNESNSGGCYGSVIVLNEEDSVAPLEKPTASIAVGPSCSATNQRLKARDVHAGGACNGLCQLESRCV